MEQDVATGSHENSAVMINSSCADTANKADRPEYQACTREHLQLLCNKTLDLVRALESWKSRIGVSQGAIIRAWQDVTMAECYLRNFLLEVFVPREVMYPDFRDEPDPFFLWPKVEMPEPPIGLASNARTIIDAILQHSLQGNGIAEPEQLLSTLQIAVPDLKEALSRNEAWIYPPWVTSPVEPVTITHRDAEQALGLTEGKLGNAWSRPPKKGPASPTAISKRGSAPTFLLSEYSQWIAARVPRKKLSAEQAEATIVAWLTKNRCKDS